MWCGVLVCAVTAVCSPLKPNGNRAVVCVCVCVQMLFPSLQSRPHTQKTRKSVSPERDRRSVSSSGLSSSSSSASPSAAASASAAAGSAPYGSPSPALRAQVFSLSSAAATSANGLSSTAASQFGATGRDMKQTAGGSQAALNLKASVSVKHLKELAAASASGSAAHSQKPKHLDGQLMCAWVSDMSGGTDLMRRVGVVHATAQIMKMREICEPIIHLYRCWTVRVGAGVALRAGGQGGRGKAGARQAGRQQLSADRRWWRRCGGE